AAAAPAVMSTAELRARNNDAVRVDLIGSFSHKPFRRDSCCFVYAERCEDVLSSQPNKISKPSFRDHRDVVTKLALSPAAASACRLMGSVAQRLPCRDDSRRRAMRAEHTNSNPK